MDIYFAIVLNQLFIFKIAMLANLRAKMEVVSQNQVYVTELMTAEMKVMKNIAHPNHNKVIIRIKSKLND